MPWVTDEQIARAREVDLLSYLQASDPRELLPPKNGEYRTASHGSLVISKGKWIWNRGGVGGRSAVDYLVSVQGMKFNDAVETVLGSCAAPVSFSLPGKTQTPLPKKSSCGKTHCNYFYTITPLSSSWTDTSPALH